MAGTCASTETLEAMRRQPASVPCNGCIACCKHDRVFLGLKDDPRAFKWHVEGGYAVLDRKDNGECVYLGESGCGIHENAPDICKRFDCRVLVLTTPPERQSMRIEQNPQMAAVYAAGRERMHTLQEAA